MTGKDNARQSPVVAALKAILDRPVAFHPALARLGGSEAAGLFLSRAVDWSSEAEDAEGWFLKSRRDWERETCLSRSEQETARKRLRDLGVIEERYQRLNHEMYYRVNSSRLQELLTAPETRTDG